jgi:hypothetical protein
MEIKLKAHATKRMDAKREVKINKEQQKIKQITFKYWTQSLLSLAHFINWNYK